MADIEYTTYGKDLGLGLMLFGGLGLVAGGFNFMMNFTPLSVFQVGIVLFLSGLLVFIGGLVQERELSTVVSMFFYGTAFSALADFVIHILLLIDIDGVQPPSGQEWLLGAINFGMFQIEPWWYFIFDTGIIGGFVLALATLVGVPAYKPYRFVWWPLLGGFIKSFGYADITYLAEQLTGGLISIRGTWSWASHWENIYYATLGQGGGGLSYFGVGGDWSAVFLTFTGLHWAAIWIAGVYAGRLVYGTRGYCNIKGSGKSSSSEGSENKEYF